MKLTGRISLSVMATCATLWSPAATIHAQTATAAERQASIRSQQMARNAMLARQRTAAQTAQFPTGYTASGYSQPSVAGTSRRGSGSAGVRSTASGANLVSMRTALGAFAADMGRMPTAAEGLGALLNRPPGAKNWRGPYISSVNWHQSLTDPWGSPYRYSVTGSGRYQQHTISSDGPDRRTGTADDLRVQF